MLQNLLWSFSKEPSEKVEDFSKDLIAYNKKITGEDFDIELYKPILHSGKVVIQYMYFDDEGEELEPNFILEADNHIFFTIEELLFKVHNEIHED